MDGTGEMRHVPYRRVTVAEAAAILGVNAVTIRRRIKRGQLEGERVHRPQGSAYLVTLPGEGADDATPTGHPVRDTSRTQATPAAPAEAMVSLIQTTITAVLGPLVAEQAALRQLVERQRVALRELERESGRLHAERDAARAELDTLRASHSPIASNLTAEAPDLITEPPARSAAPFRTTTVPRWAEVVVVLGAVLALVAAIALFYGGG